MNAAGLRRILIYEAALAEPFPELVDPLSHGVRLYQPSTRAVLRCVLLRQSTYRIFEGMNSLKPLRARAKMTVNALALAIGVKPVTVYAWESGRNDIPSKAARRIVSALAAAGTQTCLDELYAPAADIEAGHQTAAAATLRASRPSRAASPVAAAVAAFEASK